MEGSIYENIIEKFCSDNFYFEDVCIEKPDGLLNTRKYDYDLILFNSKKIIFFARLDETLSKKEIVYKLRESLNFLVTKFALGLNSFIVFGANNEQYFFLNKYNDVLKVFERDSDKCHELIDYIENELSCSVEIFDYNSMRSLCDVLILSSTTKTISGVKEKVKTDMSGKTYVNKHGAWREASELDTEILFSLAALGGMLGLHLFYQKRLTKGIFYIFTLGFFGIGWLFDCIEILFGFYRDSTGRYLVPLESKISGFITLILGFLVFVAIGFIFSVVKSLL